jgi:hypothetical protein
MKFNTLPRIFLEEYDIPNPPVPSLLVLNIAMPLFCSVLMVRQVWMSIFHIINFKKKKKIMDTGVLDFFNKKTNPGLLFLLKVRSCVFI